MLCICICICVCICICICGGEYTAKRINLSPKMLSFCTCINVFVLIFVHVFVFGFVEKSTQEQQLREMEKWVKGINLPPTKGAGAPHYVAS